MVNYEYRALSGSAGIRFSDRLSSTQLAQRYLSISPRNCYFPVKVAIVSHSPGTHGRSITLDVICIVL